MILPLEHAVKMLHHCVGFILHTQLLLLPGVCFAVCVLKVNEGACFVIVYCSQFKKNTNLFRLNGEVTVFGGNEVAQCPAQLNSLDRSVQILTGFDETFATSCTVVSNTGTPAGRRMLQPFVNFGIFIGWSLFVPRSENPNTVQTMANTNQNNAANQEAIKNDLISINGKHHFC